MPLQKKTRAKEKLDKSSSNKRILRTRVIEKPKEHGKKIVSLKKKLNEKNTNKKQRDKNEGNKRTKKIITVDDDDELVQKSLSSSYALRGHSRIPVSETKKRKEKRLSSSSNNNKNSEEDESDTNDDEEEEEEGVSTRSKKTKSIQVIKKNPRKTKKVQQRSSNKKAKKIINETEEESDNDDDDSSDEEKSVSSEEMKEKKKNNPTTTRELKARKTKSIAPKSSNVMGTRNSKGHQQKEHTLRKDQKTQQWKCEKCKQSYRTESGYYNHIPVCPSYGSSTSSSSNSDSEYSHDEEEDSLVDISDGPKGSNRPEYEESVIFSDDDDELKEIMSTKVDSSTTATSETSCIKNQKENYDDKNNTTTIAITIPTNENKQPANLEYYFTPNVISTNTATLSANKESLLLVDPNNKIGKTFSEPLKTNDNNNDQNKSTNSNTTHKPINPLVASVERFFSSSTITTTNNDNIVSSPSSTSSISNSTTAAITTFSTPISMSNTNENDNKVLQMDKFVKEPSLFSSQPSPSMCSVNNNVADSVILTKCAKYSKSGSLNNNPNIVSSKSKEIKTHNKKPIIHDLVESQSSSLNSHSMKSVLKLEEVKKKGKNKKSKSEINSSSSRNTKDKMVKMKSTSCQSTGTDTGNSIIILPSKTLSSKTLSSIGTSTSMNNNNNNMNSFSSVSSTPIPHHQNSGRKSNVNTNDQISKPTDYFQQGQQTEHLKMLSKNNNNHHHHHNNNTNSIQQQHHHVHNSSIHLQENYINPSLNEITTLPQHQHHHYHPHHIPSHGLPSPQSHYRSSSSILSPYSSPSLSSTTGSIKTNTPYTSPHIGSPNHNHRSNDSFSDAYNQLVSNSPTLNLQKSLLSPQQQQQQHHTLPSNSSNVNNYEGETITLQDDSGQIHQIPVPSIQQQLQQSAAAAAASAHLQRIAQNYNPYAPSPYLSNLNWSLQQQAALMQQQQQLQHHQPLGFVTGLQNFQHQQQQQQQQLIQQSLIGLPTQSNFTMMQHQQQLHNNNNNQYPVVSSHLHVNTMALQQPTYIDQPLSSINHNNSPYLILQPGSSNHHQFSTISNRVQPSPMYNINNNNGLPSMLPSDAQKLFTHQQHHTTTNATHYFENHHHQESSLFDSKSIPLPSPGLIPGSGLGSGISTSIIQQQQQQDRSMNNPLFLTPQNPVTSNLHASPSKISMMGHNSHNHFKTSHGSGLAHPCPCDLCLEKIRIGGETQPKSSTEPTYITQNKSQQQYNKNLWSNSSPVLPSLSKISKHSSSSSSSGIKNKKSSGKSSKKQQSNRSSNNNGKTNLKKILPALKSTVSTSTDPFQIASFSSKNVSLTVPSNEVKNSTGHKNSDNNNSVGTPIITTSSVNNNNNTSNNVAVVRPMEHPLQKLAEKFGDLNSTQVSPSPMKLSLPFNNNGDNNDNSIGSKLEEEDNQRKHINSSCHNVNSETPLINTITGHDNIKDETKINRTDNLIASQPRKSKLNDSESDSSTPVPVKRRKHAKDKLVTSHRKDSSQTHKREKDGKSKIKITLKRKEGGHAYSIRDVTTGTIDTKGTVMRSLKIKAKVTNCQGQGQSSDVVVLPVIHTVPIPFQVGSNRTIPVEGGEEDSVNIMDPLVLKKKKKNPEEGECDASESSKMTHRIVVVYEVKHGETTIFRSSNVHSIWDFIFETVQGQKTFQSNFPPLSYPGTNISLDENSDTATSVDYNALGLTHRAVQFLLSHLPSPGANSKLSTAKPKKKHSSNIETQPSDVTVVKCARIQGYQGRKPFDMFGWLASKHRTLPTIEGPNDNGKVVDLPVALRYKPLKREKSCLLGVYFSTIHGRGLFTRRDIEQGEVIIEYAGEIIRSILCDIREKHYESKGYGCYFFSIDDNMVVDATIRGNAARFINHSCDPNCRSKIDYVQGKKRILIVSLRKILGGEELTYDYKFAKEEKEKKIPCHCGTTKCRKYLN